MVKLTFLSAIRSLLKYKHISIINLLGLTAGLTAFLFITNYLIFEYSYDSFLPAPHNVYRVNLRIDKEGQNIYNGAKTPRGLYFALKNSIPEVEANGIAYFEKCLVNYENITHANQDVLWVDEGFEKVFPIEMIEGYADYSRPRSGTISETSAKTFFGNTSPIGKILRINQGMPIEITGIFKDLPSNTHLTAQYFATIKTWVEMGDVSEAGDWRWNGWWNYIRLHEGASPTNVSSIINGFTNTYMGYLDADNRKAEFTLQPLNDLHFISGIDGEMGATTNRSSLHNLIAVAIITLIIAWLNYVNLAIAHARAREHQISLRKLIGASNIHLWLQSLAESILLNISALIFSIIIYFLFMPSFAAGFSLPIAQAQISALYMILFAAVAISSGILFTSIYQGISLAGIQILPGHKKNNRRSFKNWLVMAQMALSILFLTSTIVVYRQISYMKNKDLGIELNEVVVCTGPASLNADPQKRQRYEAFRTELLSYAGFKSITFNNYAPGQEPRTGFRELYSPSSGASPDVLFFENNGSNGLIETFQMNLMAGNDFSIDPSQNYDKIILTETSMRHLGITNPENAIGQQVYRKGTNQNAMEVIGVVADFHNEGLQKPIYPIIWNNEYPREFGYFAIRIQSINASETIDRLKNIWGKHYPYDNFDFIFAGDQFNQQYLSESRFGKFYLWLTILSIGIASMGLYGLVLFTFEQRNKEIGIRKVNGAKISEILSLLNKDFLKWVAIAFVFATPVAWYAMNQWLQNFAFKTELRWWYFALAGLMTLAIALITVSYQSYKASVKNPVESLRYE